MKALKTIVFDRQSIGKGEKIPADVIAKLKEQKDPATKESGLDRLIRLKAIEGKAPAEKKAGRPPKSESAE